MSTFSREVLFLLFRNRPELVPELYRDVLGEKLPQYNEVRFESADLPGHLPPEKREYHVDYALLLKNNKPVFALVVDVQLSRDEDKKYSWPAEVALLRLELRQSVTLLIATPDASVAEWAAEPIQLGIFNVCSFSVLSPETIPVITDPERACDNPELAVLSSVTHGAGDVDRAVQIARAAIAGVAEISDRERSALYSDIVLTSLSDAARAKLQ